jgi:hypothetical protein
MGSKKGQKLLQNRSLVFIIEAALEVRCAPRKPCEALGESPGWLSMKTTR